MTALTIPDPIRQLLAAGSPLVLSVSGGKDSDAQVHALLQLYDQQAWSTENICLIYADEGRMILRYNGLHCRSLAARYHLPLHIVKQPEGDLQDTITQRVLNRPDQLSWPSFQHRWCSAHAKREPIDKWLRHRYERNADVVVAIGIRAEESDARAKCAPSRPREAAQSLTKHRRVYDLHPILNWTLADVWQQIGYTLEELAALQDETRTRLQQRENLFEIARSLNFKAHPIYLTGASRSSCTSCCLGNVNDLRITVAFNPANYIALVQAEADSKTSVQVDQWYGDIRPDLLSPTLRSQLADAKAYRQHHPILKKGTHSLSRLPKPQQLRLFED